MSHGHKGNVGFRINIEIVGAFKTDIPRFIHRANNQVVFTLFKIVQVDCIGPVRVPGNRFEGVFFGFASGG
jgi:hypothetical protein